MMVLLIIQNNNKLMLLIEGVEKEMNYSVIEKHEEGDSCMGSCSSVARALYWWLKPSTWVQFFSLLSIH